MESLLELYHMLINLKGSYGAIIVDDDDTVWFSVSKISQLLGNESKALRNISKEDRIQFGKMNLRKKIKKISPEAKYVNESGVYTWIFMSKNKTAVQFTRWITEIILPTIQKKGYYNVKKNYQQDLTDLYNRMHKREKIKGGHIFDKSEQNNMTIWDDNENNWSDEDTYSDITTPMLFTDE